MTHQVAHKRVKSHRRRDEEMALRGEAEESKSTSGKKNKLFKSDGDKSLCGQGKNVNGVIMLKAFTSNRSES